jgi:hypothetical protein
VLRLREIYLPLIRMLYRKQASRQASKDVCDTLFTNRNWAELSSSIGSSRLITDSDVHSTSTICGAKAKFEGLRRELFTLAA